MASPERRIADFISRHHVLTLATSVDNKPYCSNMFYVYMRDTNLLVFTSEDGTKHVADALRNSFAAASIVLETRIVGRVQGAQIQGYLKRIDGAGMAAARRAYIKRFPYAMAAELHLWQLEPIYIKFTDNTLGFGRKLIWQAEKE